MNINIVSRYPKQSEFLRIVLIVTTVCLLIGIMSPIITMKKFVLIENTFSIVSGVVALLQEGQIFLFLVIAVFSIVLPFLKIVLLYKLITMREDEAGQLNKYLHWMHEYGKWSMLDVFVVAVLVVAVKLGAVASVEMRFGLYAFAAAVIMTMFVTARVVSLTDQLTKESGELNGGKQSSQ